ncbi:MAG: hypothetical protein GY757_62050 [bacterium]|nr:hypothetical protein [bacterium]
MNDSENKYNLNQLFSILELKQVVCVDDQYRKLPGEALNEIIGICMEKESIGEIEELSEK